MSIHAGNSLQDRRANDRLYLSFTARYRGQAPLFQRARTLDVSECGVRLEIEEELGPHSRLTLSLNPEKLCHLSLEGRVTWCRPSWKEGVYEVGVRFDNGCSADLAWLRKRLRGLRGAVDRLASAS